MAARRAGRAGQSIRASEDRRHLRHEQPVAHALLGMPDHMRLVPWNRDRQHVAFGCPELDDVCAIILWAEDHDAVSSRCIILPPESLRPRFTADESELVLQRRRKVMKPNIQVRVVFGSALIFEKEGLNDAQRAIYWGLPRARSLSWLGCAMVESGFIVFEGRASSRFVVRGSSEFLG
jgi:hypothetical protein